MIAGAVIIAWGLLASVVSWLGWRRDWSPSGRGWLYLLAIYGPGTAIAIVVEIARACK